MIDKYGQEIRVGDTIVKAYNIGSSAGVMVGIVTNVTDKTCKFWQIAPKIDGNTKMGQKEKSCRANYLVVSIGYCLDFDKDDNVIGDIRQR